MERVAALVAQKQQKIQNLENKRNKTEEEKQKIELTLEDLEGRLDLNYQELDELSDKYQTGIDARLNLIKLFGKNVLGILLLGVLGACVNITFFYFIVAYILFNTPKYIKLIKEMQQAWGININSIKSLRLEISDLESDKDKTQAILRKLEYTLADIDSEKKIIEDILAFILESRDKTGNSFNTSIPKDLNRTRINPKIS